MIDEQRTMHQKYKNASRPEPKKYNENDIVFVYRQTSSNTEKGKLNKLLYGST